jgi:hypothetical protein
MKVLHKIDGAFRADAYILLLEPSDPRGRGHWDEIALDIFGGGPELDNWTRRCIGFPRLESTSCAVKGGRDPELGELWLLERVK